MRLGLRHFSVLAAAIVMAACAPAQMVMVYHPGGEAETAGLAWPAPDRFPRLEYAGELIGERNFITVDGSEGRGRQFLRWLAGLGNIGNEELRLARPQSGLVDSSGRILVTDAGQSSIFVFDERTGTLDVWKQAAALRNFIAPVDIVEDGQGTYLVSDSELGGVFRLGANGEPLGSFAEGNFERPTGLGIDPRNGDIYVADTAAHIVKVFSNAGDLQRIIGIPGDNGAVPGELNAPLHVEVFDGRAYVTDALNASVQVFSSDRGEPLEPIGRRGLFVGNLVRPKGVTTDTDGNVYIVESYYDHLLVFDDRGRFLLPVGGTGSGPGRFFLPAGAWSDAQNRIFIADMFNGRVVIFQFRGREG